MDHLDDLTFWNRIKLRCQILSVQAFGMVFLWALVGCVSIDFNQSKVEKSKEVEYVSPPKPFEKFDSEYLDQAWKNNENGNTISYLSECNNPTDPSLENIHRGIISEIEKATVVESSEVEFNARLGIHSIVEGRVDGVENRMQILIFKKNNCTYILTYVGLSQKFGDNQRDFHQFAKRFEVP